jgi:hypothetical protein
MQANREAARTARTVVVERVAAERQAGEWCDNDADIFSHDPVHEIKDVVTFVIGDRFECVDRANLREWFDNDNLSTVRARYTQEGALRLVNRGMPGVDDPRQPHDITFYRLPLANGDQLLFAVDVDTVMLPDNGARLVWHARPVGWAAPPNEPWRRSPVFALMRLDDAFVARPDDMPSWLETELDTTDPEAAARIRRARELHAAQQRAFGAARPGGRGAPL